MEIQRIDKGIKFAIQVVGLQQDMRYVANLCNEDATEVYSSQTNILEDGIMTFTWSAEVTEKLPADTPLTIEIFDSNREVMYRRPKFAVAKNTSAITND